MRLRNPALSLLLALTLSGSALSQPAITTQPQSASLLAGDTVVLQVTATGTPPLFYQWFKDGAPIAGATQASLEATANLTAPATIAGYLYTVTVTDGGGTTTSDRKSTRLNSSHT